MKEHISPSVSPSITPSVSVTKDIDTLIYQAEKEVLGWFRKVKPSANKFTEAIDTDLKYGNSADKELYLQQLKDCIKYGTERT